MAEGYIKSFLISGKNELDSNDLNSADYRYKYEIYQPSLKMKFADMMVMV